MGADAFGSQSGKSGVEVRRHRELFVVVGDQLFGLLALLGRIKGAMGKLMQVNLFAIHAPQHALDGDEVNDPSAGPAGEALSYELAGVVGIAGGQRLQEMLGAPVETRPR